LSLALRYEGFDVSSAHDGRGALRAVRGGRSCASPVRSGTQRMAGF